MFTILIVVLLACSTEESPRVTASPVAPEPLGHDLAGALAEYEEKCAQGNASSCTQAGFIREGTPIRSELANPARAVLLYEKGCGLEDWVSCQHLGSLYNAGAQGVEADPAKAVRWHTIGCEHGRAASCHDLGTSYKDGIGTPRDPGLARKYLKHACDAEARFCGNLGLLYATGVLGRVDLAAAEVLWRRGCDGQGADSCFNLGALASQGVALREGEGAVEDFMAKACALESGAACDYYAGLLRTGKGVSKDPIEALKIRRRACDLGHLPACEDWK